MTMLEKFKERKKAMDDNVKLIEREANAKVESEVLDFTAYFESLVQSASDEEFGEFITCDDESLDVIERITAITMRSKSF